MDGPDKRDEQGDLQAWMDWTPTRGRGPLDALALTPARVIVGVGALLAIVASVLPWAAGRAPGIGGFEDVFLLGTAGAGDGVVLLLLAAAVGVLTLHRTPAETRVRLLRALPAVLVVLAVFAWLNGWRAADDEVEAWVRRGGSGGVSIGVWLGAAGIALMAIGTIALMPGVIRWKTEADDPSDLMKVSAGGVAWAVGGATRPPRRWRPRHPVRRGPDADARDRADRVRGRLRRARRRLRRELARREARRPGAAPDRLTPRAPGRGGGRRYHGPPCPAIETSSPGRCRRSSRRACSACSDRWRGSGPMPASRASRSPRGARRSASRSSPCSSSRRRRVGASVSSIVALDRQGRATLAAAALMGVLLNAAVFSAFERIPIALALMLFYTYPAGVVVVDAVLGRETITPTRVLALLLSTTGVVLVLAGGMTGGSGAADRPASGCSSGSPRRRARSCS